MSKEAIETLIAQIKAVSATQPDQRHFLLHLQAGIEEIPGAQVAFASRDAKWLKTHGYLEDRGDLTEDELQDALCSAARKFEEGYASQDGITHAMDAQLDKQHPRVEDDGVEP